MLFKFTDLIERKFTNITKNQNYYPDPIVRNNLSFLTRIKCVGRILHLFIILEIQKIIEYSMSFILSLKIKKKKILTTHILNCLTDILLDSFSLLTYKLCQYLGVKKNYFRIIRKFLCMGWFWKFKLFTKWNILII